MTSAWSNDVGTKQWCRYEVMTSSSLLSKIMMKIIRHVKRVQGHQSVWMNYAKKERHFGRGWRTFYLFILFCYLPLSTPCHLVIKLYLLLATLLFTFIYSLPPCYLTLSTPRHLVTTTKLVLDLFLNFREFTNFSFIYLFISTGILCTQSLKWTYLLRLRGRALTE